MDKFLGTVGVIAILAALVYGRMKGLWSPIWISRGATRIPSREERAAWPKAGFAPLWQTILFRTGLVALVVAVFWFAEGPSQRKLAVGLAASTPIILDGAWEMFCRWRSRER